MRGQRDKGGTQKGGPHGVLGLQDAFDPGPGTRFTLRWSTPVDHRRFLHHAAQGIPATRLRKQMPQAEAQGGKEDHHLDHIRPDHRTDASHRRVEGGEHRDAHERHGVEPEFLHRRRRRIDEDPPTQHQQHGRHPQAGAAGQQSGDQKHRRGDAPRAWAKADLEELIHAHHIVAVIGRDEESAHHQTCQQVARHELDVGVIAQRIAFARSAEKSARADFRRQDGSQHGPPGDLTIPECEALHAAAFAALRKANAEDEAEVGKEDEGVDEKRGHAARSLS